MPLAYDNQRLATDDGAQYEEACAALRLYWAGSQTAAHSAPAESALEMLRHGGNSLLCL